MYLVSSSARPVSFNQFNRRLLVLMDRLDQRRVSQSTRSSLPIPLSRFSGARSLWLDCGITASKSCLTATMAYGLQIGLTNARIFMSQRGLQLTPKYGAPQRPQFSYVAPRLRQRKGSTWASAGQFARASLHRSCAHQRGTQLCEGFTFPAGSSALLKTSSWGFRAGRL